MRATQPGHRKPIAGIDTPQPISGIGHLEAWSNGYALGYDSATPPYLVLPQIPQEGAVIDVCQCICTRAGDASAGVVPEP